MSEVWMRKRSWMLVLALLLAGPAAARDFEQRLEVEPGGRLVVRLDAGRVEVEGHDEDEVRVAASHSGPGGELDWSLERRDDGEVELRARRGGILGWISMAKVRVHVRVPEEFSVDVQTSGAEIEVRNLEGQVVARTSGGAVGAEEIEGDVELRTSGGEVRAQEIEGDLLLRTSGGPIRIDEVEGRIDAETSGGEIQAHDVTGPVRLRSSGGPISVRFSEAPAGEIRTSGGGIELEFPEGEGLHLEAETSGGGVDLDVPISPSGRLDANRVSGDLNGGGERLEVRTSGGTIRIRER